MIGWTSSFFTVTQTAPTGPTLARGLAEADPHNKKDAIVASGCSRT